MITLVGSPAGAAEGRRRVVVVGSQGSPPYEFLSAHGEPRGILVDLWRLWSEATGVEVEYLLTEPDQALDLVRRGRADVVGGLVGLPAVEPGLAYSPPLLSVPSYVFFPRQMPALKGLEDLAGFAVGLAARDRAIRGEALAAGARVENFATYEELLARVLAGRLKVFVAPDPVAGYLLARQGREGDFLRSEQPVAAGLVRAAVAADDEALLDLVNNGWQAVTSEDRARVLDAWSGRPLEVAGPGLVWLLPALAFGAPFLAAVGLWWGNRRLRGRLNRVAGRLAQVVSDLDDSRDEAREHQEKYRLLVDNQPDLIVEADLAGRLLFVGPSFLATTGKNVEQVLGQNFWFLTHADDIGPVQDMFHRLALPPYTAQLDCRLLAVGGWRWLAWTARAVPDELGRPRTVVAVGRDITRNKEAERERGRLAAMVHQAKEGMVIADPDGQVVYANPAFLRLSGFSWAELAGRDLLELHGGLTAHAQKEIAQVVAQGGVWTGVLSPRKKDGSPYEVESSLFKITCPDHQSAGTAVISRDVTHEMMLERQLAQAQKMEAIGTLAGGIAHDFNNLLTSIMGYTQMVQRLTTQDSPAQGHLEQVLTAGRRATSLVEQILAFSRYSEHNLRPVRLWGVVREAVELVRGSLPRSITLVPERGTSGDWVLADASRLSQVVMNLLTNAVYALKKSGGEIRVALAERGPGEEGLPAEDSPEGAGLLVLEVSDNGPGMDAATQARIFEPYFTTKPPGEGTGMGLALCREVVTGLQGNIEVETAPERGTTFRVLLPALAQPGGESPGAAAVGPMAGNGECILLVDDEGAVLALCQELLSDLGYQVTALAEPAEAADLLREGALHFDMLITDRQMPGFSGEQLAQTALEHHPGLPVILCTGLNGQVGQGDDGLFRAVVHKPFQMNELARTVRKVLDEAGVN
ncbi:MAG: PAS domain S-box protein [Deltaproteobacteria bacterium]|nr:PAS domain S-box protein [Deltaproteobacteria bacterium]